ncbi:MAG TPA: LysR family transcriptional regulator [Caulobacteraceae bacterium]|nr:LysR family transcriptional regulator [Caulobacteraceae bacterium]
MSKLGSLNLRHLEGFVALRRNGSFTAAAREISLTQSALTQAVAAIEKRADRRLFDRGSQGAQPTPAAEILADAFQRGLDRLDSAISSSCDPQNRLTRRVSFNQLLAMSATENFGSFRRAARATGLSEASIHRAVRALEQTLGEDLLLRTKLGVTPTAAGSSLASSVRRAKAEFEAGFEDIKANGVPKLSIGTTPTLRVGLLSNAIAALWKDGRNVRFRIEDARYAESISGLMEGVYDFVLCPVRTDLPASLVQRVIGVEKLEIAARVDHPLIRTGRTPDAQALAEYPWICNPPGTPRRAAWEQLFLSQGVNPPLPHLECKPPEAICSLLAISDALALIPFNQLQTEAASGALTTIKFPAPPALRDIAIITRANWRPDPTQQRLIDLLRNTGATDAKGLDRL